MKKKMISILLVFAMVMSFIPTTAFAAGSDYDASIELVKQNTVQYNSKSALEVKFMLQTQNEATIKGGSYAVIAINLDKFDVLYYGDGEAINVNNEVFENERVSFANNDGTYAYSAYKSGTKKISGNTVFYKDGSKGIIALMPDTGTNVFSFETKTSLMSIVLGLKDEASWDDINLNDIRFATKDEAGDMSSTAVVGIANDTETVYYRKSDGSADTLTKQPTLSTEGFVLKEPPKPSLGGTVTISNTTPVIGDSLSAITNALDFNGESLGTLGYQWTVDGADVEGATASSYTVKAADFGKTITVTVTNSNNSGGVTSDATAAVVKKDYSGSAATAATVDKTETTVTVNNVVSGQEYAITKGSSVPDSGWNTTGEFTGLSANTSYTVYTRVAETADTKASESVATSVTTDKLTQTIEVPTGTITVTYGNTLDLNTVCSSNPSGNTLTFMLNGTVPAGSSFNASKGVIDATGATAEGTFKVKVNAAAYGDYNVADEQEVTISIEKKPAATVTVEPKAKSGLTYTGSAQELITAGTANGGTMMYKVGTGAYSTDIPKGIDAKTYTVYYYVMGDANHSDSVEQNFTVTIGKADASIATAPVAKSDLKYNGLAQELITAGATSDGTMQYKLGASGTYGTEIPKGTDAGTYTVYYKVVGDENHDDYEVATPISVTIDKADASVNTAPIAKAGLKYTGSAQDLIAAGTANGGIMQYKLGESGTYDAAIPQGTDAGTYQVYYKVLGDANHNDYEAATPISVTIDKADASVNTAPIAKSGLKYTGSAQELITAGATSDGTMQYRLGASGTYGTEIPKGTDAGAYTVYYKVLGDANHNDYEVATPIDVTIDKAEASVTTAPVAKTNLKYTGSAQELITAGATSDGTMQYRLGASGTYDEAIPKGTDIGTYTVYYKVLGDANHNDYEAATPINVTIDKAEASVTTAPVAKEDLKYNGLAQELITAGATSDGTMQYKLGASGTYGTEIPKGTDAGTYTVYYKVVGDENHDDYEVATPISVTIDKADASVNTAPIAKAGLKYTGSAQELITAGATSDGTMQYKLGASGTYGTEIPKGTDAGTYTVYYKVLGDANHNDYAAATPISVTIDKADASVNTAPIAKSGLKYTGSAQELITAGATSDGTMQYRLGASGTYGTEIPKGTDAGTYTVYYKVLGDANHNDYEIPTPVSVIIGKADAPEAPASVTGDYSVSTTDDTKFVYTVNTIVGAEYSKDGITYQDSNVFDGISPDDTVTFYARMKETANVNVGVAGNTGPVTFNKLDNLNVPVLSFQVTGDSGNRKITVTPVEGAEYSFDGGATWAVTNEKDGINDEIVNVQIRYKATVTLNASAPATASINTAKQIQTLNFTESAVNKKYSDADFVIVAVNDKADGGAIKYSSSNSGVAVVDADTGNVTIKGNGTTTIKAKALENETYAQSAEVAYTLTVAKGTITIKANNKNAYIGDAVPPLGTLDYTVAGLRVGETLATLPTIDYESAPDMTVAGTTTIKVSGAVAPTGENYNEIVYQNGILTVSTKSSGGGGGLPVTPSDQPTQSGKTTSVDMSGSTVSKGGQTTTTVDKKAADKLVETAVANKSEEIVISAATKNQSAASGIKASEVALPADTLQTIADKTDANIVIKADVAEVKMDNQAAEAIASQAQAGAAGKNETVSIIAEKVKEEAKEVRYELKVVTSSGTVISDFNGGNVSVTINVPKSLSNKKLVCVYIDENGFMHKVDGVLNSDGTYTFTTGHFSEYAVMAEEEADNAIEEQKEAIKAIKFKLRSELVKTKSGKTAVKLTWTNPSDIEFEGVSVYRSTKKNSGYGKKPIYVSKSGMYINTAVKPGKKYYYKVRGFVTIDGEKVYTDYSYKAYRAVK